ncbi:uncharacterized protein LOC103720002 [Phoenix dactylifera]|uniref:Uncharacterized protein LOC103720002 n=1 Tax=Phoenix dactylifera TaxID=42345 RepID=A0A8B7CW66_PHODC|nr:uncharacterized protein LOC103720002 [Phoenix dactylifera]XP_008807728.2 uncharacterized protein LOC103720002 [Phoenix dactylifera]XP_008807729.2 uncharacterized protein LOC103720002 [Phoenix dactylifera]
MELRREAPTLLELCKQLAIYNVRYIGNVEALDLHLLKDILPHCTIDQLTRIEDATKGRDLSPVTDDLWKRFYENQFGVDNTNNVIRKMKQKRIVFKWRRLYEAKMKVIEEEQNQIAKKIKQRYEESEAKRQSRQIRLCNKVPPSSGKRSFYGGSGSSNSCSNLRGNLMKKAKMEYLNSHEARIHAAMRKNALERKSFPTQSTPRSSKPNNFSGNSLSSSKLARPGERK